MIEHVYDISNIDIDENRNTVNSIFEFEEYLGIALESYLNNDLRLLYDAIDNTEWLSQETQSDMIEVFERFFKMLMRTHPLLLPYMNSDFSEYENGYFIDDVSIIVEQVFGFNQVTLVVDVEELE